MSSKREREYERRRLEQWQERQTKAKASRHRRNVVVGSIVGVAVVVAAIVVAVVSSDRSPAAEPTSTPDAAVATGLTTPLSRRRLLTLAGGAVLVGACSSGSSSSPTTTVAATTSTFVGLRGRLRDSFRGSGSETAFIGVATPKSRFFMAASASAVGSGQGRSPCGLNCLNRRSRSFICLLSGTCFG